MLSVIGVWLMWSNRVPPNENKDTTGHKWDGDLEEYNNPMPRWWLGLFYVTVVFAVGYVVLFPGLGSYAGTLGWSQVGQYEEEVAKAEERYGAFYAQFRTWTSKRLAQNDAGDERRRTTSSATTAPQCHGSDGAGRQGLPQPGRRQLAVRRGPGDDPGEHHQRAQRHHACPGGDPRQRRGGGRRHRVRALAERSLEQSAERAARGQEKFAVVCAACHMPDGTGMEALGAPNLTDDVWIYGGTREDIRYGIVNGRANQMPAQLDLLGEDRVRLMAAYVMRMARDGGG